MTDLSWHFAQPAEAHEAYLVTELGNLFSVEDAITMGVGGNHSGLGALSGSITQALLGYTSQITEKTPRHFEFLTGTGTQGDLHTYTPFFTIPPTVLNSSNGYIGLFKELDTATTIPIPNFFTTYSYSDATNTLRNTGYSGLTPSFGSVEIASATTSRLLSGSVTSSYGGFYVTNPGTYVVKLEPGFAYSLPHDVSCDGTNCDRVSVISSDRDLLLTTTSGLRVTSAGISTSYSMESGAVSRGSSGRIWDATMLFGGGFGTGGAHISSTGNLVITGPTSLTGERFHNCDQLGDNLNWHFRSSGTHTLPLTNPSFSTSTSDGKTFLNGVKYETDFDIGGASYHSNSDRAGHWACKGMPYATTIGFGDYHYNLNDPTAALSTVTYMTTSGGGSKTVYDSGVPVRHHYGYWANNQTERVYRDTSTLYDPSHVIVNQNNMYMVVEKNTPVGYLDVSASNVTNASLTIRNLPPNIIFALSDDNRDNFIVGSTGRSGTITIPYDPLLIPSTITGLEIDLFTDSTVLDNLSGMVVIDHHNGWIFTVNTGQRDGTVYVSEQYVTMPIPLDDTVIDMVGLGAGDCSATMVEMPHLAGTYNGGDRIDAPVIPGFDRVCYTIGEEQYHVEYRYLQGDALNVGDTVTSQQAAGGSIGSDAVVTSATTVQVTTFEEGEIDIILEGMINAESNVRFVKEYKGETRSPGETAFPNNAISMSFQDARICGQQPDGPSLSGWSGGRILAMTSPSGPPGVHGDITVSIEVLNNGETVLTKTILSEPVSAHRQLINTSVPEHQESVVTYYQRNPGIYCPLSSAQGPQISRIGNDLMFCNSGYYTDPNVHIPLCTLPATPTQCGYGTMQQLSNKVFREHLSLSDVEIGDVIEVQITSTNSVGLDSFSCGGQPVSSSTGHKSGPISIDIMNPSLRLQ